MNKDPKLKEYQLAFRKVIAREQKIGFLIHGFFYIIVNAGLITLNLSSSSSYKWFYWPLLSWGFGLAMHYIFGILLLNKFMKKREIRAEKLVMNNLKS